VEKTQCKKKRLYEHYKIQEQAKNYEQNIQAAPEIRPSHCPENFEKNCETHRQYI